MNTVSQAFDSRAMPLAEPSTAPSAAYSLWRWVDDLLSARLSARQQATPHDHSHDPVSGASDMRPAPAQRVQRPER